MKTWPWLLLLFFAQASLAQMNAQQAFEVFKHDADEAYTSGH